MLDITIDKVNKTMNKQQAQEQLEKLMTEAEKLKTIINGPDKTKEERFYKLIQGLILKEDKKEFPGNIFYFKGDKFWLEYNEKNRYVWVRYDGFWDVFEEDYGLGYQEIKDFLKGMLESHFKWEGVTPISLSNIFRDMLEEHFKCISSGAPK